MDIYFIYIYIKKIRLFGLFNEQFSGLTLLDFMEEIKSIIQYKSNRILIFSEGKTKKEKEKREKKRKFYPHLENF